MGPGKISSAQTGLIDLNLCMGRNNSNSTAAGPGLWAALGEGEPFTAACACSALCKLALKLEDRKQATQAIHLAAKLLAHHKQHSGNPTT